MDLDDIAHQIHLRGLILSYSHTGYATLAFHYHMPAWLREAIHAKRRGLARLMHDGDIRLCPAPGLHRASWYHAGAQRYACGLCQKLERPAGATQHARHLG